MPSASLLGLLLGLQPGQTANSRLCETLRGGTGTRVAGIAHLSNRKYMYVSMSVYVSVCLVCFLCIFCLGLDVTCIYLCLWTLTSGLACMAETQSAHPWWHCQLRGRCPEAQVNEKRRQFPSQHFHCFNIALIHFIFISYSFHIHFKFL